MWNDKIKKLFLNYGGLFDYVYYSSKDIELHFRLGLTAHIYCNGKNYRAYLFF